MHKAVKSGTPTARVVVGEGEKLLFPVRTRILAVVLVVLLIFVIWVLIVRSQSRTGTPAQYTQVTTEASNLRASGDYRQAADSLEEYAASTTDNTRKVAALTEAATLYESEGKFAQAQTKYLAIEKLNQATFKPEYKGIARCAEALGNNEQAVVYYRKALANLPKSDIGYSQSARQLQTKIDALQKKVDQS